MIVELQRAVIDKAGVAEDAILSGHRIDAFQHEADEPIALALDSFHDRAAIGTDGAVELQAELRPARDGVCGVCGGNQELAGHAAHAGAGRAMDAAFDQDGAFASRGRGAIRSQAGGPGADDGDIDGNGFHDELGR